MRFTCAPGGVDIKKHRKALQNADFWTRAAREWYKLYTPYVPMDTGRLLRDVRIGPGTIEPPRPLRPPRLPRRGARFSPRQAPAGRRELGQGRGKGAQG